MFTALADTSADDLAYLRGQLSDDYEDLFATDAEPSGPPPEPPPAEPPGAEPARREPPRDEPPAGDPTAGDGDRDAEPRVRREAEASAATDRSARPD